MSDLSQQALNPLTASASELRAAFADSRELDQIFGEKRAEAEPSGFIKSWDQRYSNPGIGQLGVDGERI